MKKLLILTATMLVACSQPTPTPRTPTVASTEAAPVQAKPQSAPDAGTPPPEVAEKCRDRCWGRGECTLKGTKCIATSDADCARSQGCGTSGKCAAVNGRCVPTTDEHCAASGSCESGNCIAHEGQCRVSCDDAKALQIIDRDPKWAETRCVKRSTSCADSVACQLHGFCTEDGDDWCELTSDDCARQPACKAEGKCTLIDGVCGVGSDADCAASSGCKETGQCWADLERSGCVGPEEFAEYCEENEILRNATCVRPLGYACVEECKNDNRCDPHDFGGYVMCVEAEGFCRSRPECAQYGVCERSLREWYSYNKCGSDFERNCGEWVFGGCAKAEEDCAKSVDCRKRGNCSAATRSQYCRPTRREHCEQSEICKEEGQCKLLDESSYHICGD